MGETEITALMRQSGALVEDTHVILPSGAHSNGYFDQKNLVTSESYQKIIARALVVRLLEFEARTGNKIRCIVGPLSEGGIWGNVVRSYLVTADPTREIRAVLTRRSGHGQALVVDAESAHQDSTYVSGRQVAIMNDVISTGTSVGPITKAVQAAEGFPTVILSLCDRRVGSADLRGLEVISLVKVSWQIWEPDDCPLCPDLPFTPRIGGNH